MLVWGQAGKKGLGSRAQREVLWGRGAWGLKEDGQSPVLRLLTLSGTPCGLRMLTWTLRFVRMSGVLELCIGSPFQEESSS